VRAIGSNGSVIRTIGQCRCRNYPNWILPARDRDSPARPMLDPTTISVGPPIMSRCSTLSRLISDQPAGVHGSRADHGELWLPATGGGLSGPAPKNAQSRACADEARTSTNATTNTRNRHAAKH
jgi:hypothetical protein